MEAFTYRDKTEAENKAWAFKLDGVNSIYSHYKALGMQENFEIGTCGRGTKNHKLRVRYIPKDGSRVILDIDTVCGAGYVHHRGTTSHLSMNQGLVITCNRCNRITLEK